MQTQPDKTKRSVVLLAWGTTLLVSSLPNILWQEFFGTPTIWLLWSKLIFLAILMLLSLFWKPAGSLRAYFFLILALYLAEEASQQLSTTEFYQTLFPQSSSFTISMLSIQVRKVAVAFIMIILLMLIYKHPGPAFLLPGKYNAPAKKEGFLIDEGTSWSKLGWISAVCITGGTLAFLFIAGRPSMGDMTLIVPLLPMVFVLAAMNAFGEEIFYRSTVLAPLEPAVGTRHSTLLSAIFFGLGHFYGVPYGIIGVVMATVLGYFLSKAMLETRGFFWPWLIHFFQDIAIFTFMAIGAIVAGGG